MKACIQTSYSESFKEALGFTDSFAIPDPQEGEVQVKVSRAASNPVNYKITEGVLAAVVKFPMPFVIGSDFSGVVSKIPAGANTSLKVGDRVAGFADLGTQKGKGSMAEFISVKAGNCAVLPSTKVSYDAAAALPLVANTTFQALHDVVRLRKGAKQKVLILGGSTATGMLALQMCRDYGCAEIVTTSSSEEMCKGHGATEVYNYKKESEKWEVALKDKAFDIVYDCVGGYQHWTGACKVLKKSGGRYVTIVGDDPGAKVGLGRIAATVSSTVNRKFWSQFGWPEYHIRTSLDGAADKGLSYFLGLLENGSGASLSIVDKSVEPFPFSANGAAAMWEKQRSGTCKGKLVMAIADDL